MTVPVAASSSVTVSSSWLATQTGPPLEETPKGKLPTGIVLMTVPVAASSSVTVPCGWKLVTQT